MSVLRLGHRLDRDKRMSMHVALTARAFGASKIYFSGDEDQKLVGNIQCLVENWGGGFQAEYTKKPLNIIKNFSNLTVHLTMYGLPLNKELKNIQEGNKKLLVVVGGAKVPADVYDLVDYNIAVGSQPHSEVAALAVFLDRLFQGRELEQRFLGGKTILPSARDKKFSN